MARTTPPSNPENGNRSRRRRPPAITIGGQHATGEPGVPGKARAYASPSRAILDQIGAPRAIQRIMASTQPTISAPACAHASSGADRQIRSVADIGARVRDARIAMGMTQQRFADLAGVGRRFLIELEHGKSGLEIGRVLAVCKAAGVRLGFLP